MKELVFIDQNYQIVTSSRKVAEVFGKLHPDVVRAADNLLEKGSDNQCNAKLQNMFQAFYEDVPLPNGGTKKAKYYLMNRDGFTLLAMGFTGDKALKFKIAYIDAFNAMEEELKQQRLNAPKSDPLRAKMDAATFAMASLKMTQREKRALGNEILTMAGLSPLPDLPHRVRTKKEQPQQKPFKPAPFKNMNDQEFSCPIWHREMRRFLPRELKYYVDEKYIERMMHAGAVRRISTINSINSIVIDNYELSDEWSYYGWNKKEHHVSGLERTVPYFYSSRVEELMTKINTILEQNPIINI